MSPRGSALRIVAEHPEELSGDASLTEEAMRSWTPAQRRCRARKRHNWLPFTVHEYRSHYEVVERCTCLNRRVADFAKTGRRINDWKPDYRGNYLLPKGAMRVTEDLHDELVLGDILSRRIVEVLEEDDV